MKITVNDISFSYGTQTVLSHVSLAFSSEHPVVLTGSSGRGKTTLLRLLAGLQIPQNGHIDGITSETRISVLFQEDRLFPQLSIYKNLELIRPGLSMETAARILAQLNLDQKILNMFPRELSGGMRRRTALARALLFESDVLLLDEPFQGLDAATHQMALEAIRKWKKDRPLLLVSHTPSDAETLDAEIVKI
jgi:ABC-type nitrate/sulfonate/bicarbonate transport system ATPase subunit